MLALLLRIISLLKLGWHFREKWANVPDVIKLLIECKWFNFFSLKRRLVKNYARALKKSDDSSNIQDVGRTANNNITSSHTTASDSDVNSKHNNFRRLSKCFIESKARGLRCEQDRQYTSVGTLIVATIYLKLIQNRYMFRSFTVLQCSHQHCVQPVASDVEVVGYLQQRLLCW